MGSACARDCWFPQHIRQRIVVMEPAGEGGLGNCPAHTGDHMDQTTIDAEKDGITGAKIRQNALDLSRSVVLDDERTPGIRRLS